jgi:hypothetical protein
MTEPESKDTNNNDRDIREMIVIHRNEAPQQKASLLGPVEQIAKILSILAVPIVVAVVGSSIQNAVSTRSTKQEYVKMSLSILQASDSDPSLRGWAAQLLNENSPTKFDQEVVDRLTAGEALLPDAATLEKMIYDRRQGLIDDFIVASDAYTKGARRVFETRDPAEEELFKEELINGYNLQKARMKAYFGSDLNELITESDSLNDRMFELFKRSPAVSDDVWKPAVKELVNKNIEITNRAIQLSQSPSIP